MTVALLNGMNVSLYQAAAAMNANLRWQDVVTDNLSSSAVPGARKQQMSFSAVEAGMAPGLSGFTGGRYLMPSGTTSVNFQQGQIRPSGAVTDLAIEGPGFLEVQLPNGTHAFTRDGELHLSAQGQLITKQGYAVIGDSGPVQLDPANTAPLSISPTGDVSQGGEVKGHLRLTEFNQPALLKSLGAGFFLADNPNLQASTAQASSLRQGFLEAANTSPTTEMASLLTSMRMFEANQRVMQLQDERMGRVISELGNPS